MNKDTPETNTSEAWSRFSAAMEALNGTKPSPGDSYAASYFRMWMVGYLAGISDAINKSRISL